VPSRNARHAERSRDQPFHYIPIHA
jgi:hypothetical protein